MTTSSTNPSGRGRPCSVCALPGDGTAIIDAALRASGLNASKVHREVGEAMGLTLSALFRHSRGHLALLPVTMTPTSGTHAYVDALVDIERVRSQLVELHDNAHARGDANAAARTGHESAFVTTTLTKELGITSDDILSDLMLLRVLVSGVYKAARVRPEWAEEFAHAASGPYDSVDSPERSLSRQLEEIATKERTAQAQKENHDQH